MIDDCGVISVAYGGAWRKRVLGLVASVADWPVVVVSDRALEGVESILFRRPGPGARWAKLHLDALSPFKLSLYMDADTAALADISALFGMLGDGWELVIAPSARQGADVLGHLPRADRVLTLEQLGGLPLNLQAGVFGFRQCGAIRRLFAAWREEWRRFEDQDQGALLRALGRVPVRVWLLGRAWNGGEVVGHYFDN
jgi:hypothetical protein